MSQHAYQDADDEVAAAYRRIHANGERTHVYIVSMGRTDYAVLATDVDPATVEGLTGECIAVAPTLEGAHEHAARWMDRHPKGILGASADGSRGGWLSKVWAALSKLDQSDTQQQEEGESA